MNRRKAIIISTVVVALVGLSAWAFGFFNRIDPAVAELQQLGKQMWDPNVPEDQRNQLRDDFRQRIESMSEDQRRAFFDSNRDQWTERSQRRMDEFFAMPKTEQQKRLDEILDRMVKYRNSQQANANNGQQGQRSRDASGGGRSGRNMTDTQREERSKRRLDQTTPKMRAQYTQFRKMLDARAQQRGITVGDQRGGWGGFPGGGRPRG